MTWIKRILWALLVAAAVLTAVVVSGLNTTQVPVNLYFWQLETSLGVVLLLALLAGLLLGLLFALLLYVLPLKARNRRLLRQLKRLQAATAPVGTADIAAGNPQKRMPSTPASPHSTGS